ncbi:MAG: FtsX-like permease family protein, partial [Clostridiales bacterium]
TVLGILVIFFLGTIYSLFMDMNNIASMNQKYNIMYSDFEDKRKVPDDKLTELINDNKLKLKNKVCIEYLYPLVEDDFSSEYQPILSKSIYNNLTNSNLAINSGEIVRLNMNGDKDKPLPEVYPFDTFTLKFGNEIFSFKFKAPEERNIVINYDVQPSKWLLIINDDDFEKIKSEVNINFKRVFIAIDFYEWKETSQLVHDIKKELDYEDEYSKYPVNDERNKDILGISSRIDYYNTIKKELSMTLFIVAFLGGVFLLCSGSITYFKIITNITEKKEKYIKLRKIGITKNEFKKMIKSELKVIFFIPLVFSSVISTILIYILYISSLYPERFSRNMLLVIIYYSFFQVIYYLLAKMKYIKSII